MINTMLIHIQYNVIVSKKLPLRVQYFNPLDGTTTTIFPDTEVIDNVFFEHEIMRSLRYYKYFTFKFHLGSKP